MFRQLLVAKFLCVILAVNGNGQVATPESPPVEDPAPPALAVTITGPTAPVPIGTKQTLTATHESVEMPGYFWSAKCSIPVRTQDDWTGATIEDCVGQEAVMQYNVKVTHMTPDKGGLDVSPIETCSLGQEQLW